MVAAYFRQGSTDAMTTPLMLANSMQKACRNGLPLSQSLCNRLRDREVIVARSCPPAPDRCEPRASAGAAYLLGT